MAQSQGGQAVKTSTETLIKAMRILSSDIQSDDGVANVAIAEAAQRLEEQKDRIKRLEEALSWRWRPIETAPYNHTWVLGYDEKDGEIGMIIFERGDESEPQWTDVVRTWSPTHWMPLPEPPKAKEAKP
jgi:hypothetical protein